MVSNQSLNQFQPSDPDRCFEVIVALVMIWDARMMKCIFLELGNERIESGRCFCMSELSKRTNNRKVIALQS